MSSDLVNRLVDLLRAEEDLYLELRSALQSEQRCLVEIDAEGLDEAVRQKETLVAEARMLGESRGSVVETLATELGICEEPVTLSRIGAALGPEASALRQAHARLTALVAAVRELLEVNAGFAGDAMTQVRGTLQLLGRLAPGSGTYGPEGTAPAGTPGRLVRQSA